MHDIAQKCREIAESKGFDVCTWENLATKLMFVVSEIDETCEAMWESPHSDKFGEELADIAIRTMTVLETLWPDWSTGRIEQRHSQLGHPFQRPEVLLWPMLRYARKGLEHWRNDERRDTQQCFELLLLELWRVADTLSINLDNYIQRKIMKNAGRPMRNGKVRSEG